ncbi:MAG TPA: L-seryl-tRNA(Sec) selenium transferase, partial [Vicinamibacteria bacterium]|nr:L-seryl-tRNA(Sec) selenium transferase [Vicinamibacteria bacterium]
MSRSDIDLRRRLPSVDEVLRDDEVRDLETRHGRELLLRHVRPLLDEARSLAGRGDEAGLTAALADLPARLGARLETAAAPSLTTVINATGVVIHTNLGRAPLPAAAAARVADIAASYSNLEFDLESGERGARETHAEGRLRALLGAEAAVVVNNNAAAVLLAVNTLAEGREVVVSRGELVEIGGSFRMPDVLRKGGARLREVGTTNRTRLADYEAAIGPETGLVLKVHPSNFRIVGFTEAPSLAELAALARARNVPLVEDLGSGALSPLPPPFEEPAVAASLRTGADLVTFSGDKLVGGPQAGLAVGRQPVVDALRRNPLYRALRVDKMTLAALDAVLAAHEEGRAAREVPVVRMLWLSAEDVRRRAEPLAAALAAEVPGLEARVVAGSSAAGGGAAPGTDVPTAL